MENDWIAATLYPNGTLKNKLGIQDSAELAEKEFQITARVELMLLQSQIKVKTVADLVKIHKLMFDSLYDWAGQYRMGDFGKGNTLFFPRERFDYGEEDINHAIAILPKKKPLAASDYAGLIDKINFFHPFREGNGRSTRLFLQLLAQEHGQVIDYPLTNDKMIEAENAADVKRIASLIKIEKIAK